MQIFGHFERIDDISWCQCPELFEPVVAGLPYGNDAGIETYYQSVVMVPKFTSRRGSAVTMPSPPAKKQVGVASS